MKLVTYSRKLAAIVAIIAFVSSEMALAAHLGVYVQLGKLVNIDVFEKGHYAVEAQLCLTAKHASICSVAPVKSNRMVAKGSVGGEGEHEGASNIGSRLNSPLAARQTAV